MPFLDTNHQRAAILILALGIALIVALSTFATGLVGIPVLYVVFQPVHDWLARRTSPRLSAARFAVSFVHSSGGRVAAGWRFRSEHACTECNSLF